ncbi:MAG: hypothetical protein EAX86_03870 [Candidatus Heimdallarchaeota archaeon]|nr:hypothetical protein [Candidatus Heimdallarchaeota archaeon]
MTREQSDEISYEKVTSGPITTGKSSIKGSNLVVVLADEGGLPVYTRSIHIDKSGYIHERENETFDPKNESVVLISGLIEAIMQLKEIVRPTLIDITLDKESDKPIYVDYAKAPDGISLLSLSTSPEFQQLPINLLKYYTPLRGEFDKSIANWNERFVEIVEDPINEDAAIYWRILSQIKRELSEFVSFILVYDPDGNYLFSTARNQERGSLPDPLLDSISKYIKQEYLLRKYRNNVSLIGAKRLRDSVIWHFKCFDKIFVFFTYRVPDLHTFSTLQSEMITFISNNLERFIETANVHSLSSSIKKNFNSTRFIFLS